MFSWGYLKTKLGNVVHYLGVLPRYLFITYILSITIDGKNVIYDIHVHIMLVKKVCH